MASLEGFDADAVAAVNGLGTLASASFNVAANRILLVTSFNDTAGSSTAKTISDNKGLTWTPLNFRTLAETGGNEVYAWFAYVTTAQTGVIVTVTSAQNYSSVVKVVIGDAKMMSLQPGLSGEGQSGGIATAATTGAFQPTKAGSRTIAFICHGQTLSSTAPTAGSGTQFLAGVSNVMGAFSYGIGITNADWASGTQSITINFPASSGWDWSLAEIKHGEVLEPVYRSGFPVIHETNSGGSTRTTPSFTVPANTRVYVTVTCNGTGAVSFASPTGGGLTWSVIELENIQEGGVVTYTAFNPSSQSMTFAVTITGGDATNEVQQVVHVFDNADDEATFWGHFAGANQNNTGAPTVNVTTRRPNSHVIAASSDWNATNTGTPNNGHTLVDKYHTAGRYTGYVWKTTTKVAARGSTNMSLGDSNAQDWNVAAFEVMGKSTGADPDPPPPLVYSTVGGGLGSMGFGDQPVGHSYESFGTGGTNYSRSITDSIGLLDIGERVSIIKRVPADVAGLQDAIARIVPYKRAPLDTLVLSDVAVGLRGLPVALLDPVGLSDVASRQVGYSRPQWANVGLSDRSAGDAPRIEFTLGDSLNSTSATLHPVEYPASVPAGLTVVLSMTSSGALPPTGFSRVPGSVNSLYVHFVKDTLTNGTEGGTTIDVTFNSGARSAAILTGLSGTDPSLLSIVEGTVTSRTPGSIVVSTTVDRTRLLRMVQHTDAVDAVVSMWPPEVDYVNSNAGNAASSAGRRVTVFTEVFDTPQTSPGRNFFTQASNTYFTGVILVPPVASVTKIQAVITAGGVALNRTISDVAGLADSLARVVAAFRSKADDETLSDVFARTAAIRRSVLDDSGLTEPSGLGTPYFTNFSGIPSGNFLPQSGWIGGPTPNSWQVYQGNTGTHTDVLYNNFTATHVYRNVGVPDMEIETVIKTSTAGNGSISGVVVRLVDDTHYVTVELVKHEGTAPGVATPESKFTLAIRDLNTHYDYDMAFPTLAYETEYTVKVRIVGNHIWTWINGALWHDQDLTSTELAAVAGGTGGGLINYHGNANFDSVTITPIVAAGVTYRIGKQYFFSESLLSDTISRSMTMIRNKMDLSGLVDTITRSGVTKRAPSDLAGLSDTVARTAATRRAVSDNAGISDSDVYNLARVLVAAITDPVGMSDAAARLLVAKRPVGETQLLTDAVNRIVVARRSIADTEVLSDADTYSLTRRIFLTETAQLTDVANRVYTAIRSKMDTPGPSEQVVYQGTGALNRLLSDVMTLTDNILRAGATKRTVSDTEALTDAIARSVQYRRSQSDTEALTDTSTRTSVVKRVASDLAGLSDTMTRRMAMVRAALDDMGIIETVQKNVTTSTNWTRSITDAVGLVESIVRKVVGKRTASDTLALSDTVTRQRVIRATITENLTILDTATRKIVIRRGLSDGFSLTDTIVVLKVDSGTGKVKVWDGVGYTLCPIFVWDAAVGQYVESKLMEQGTDGTWHLAN